MPEYLPVAHVHSPIMQDKVLELSQVRWVQSSADMHLSAVAIAAEANKFGLKHTHIRKIILLRYEDKAFSKSVGI